MRPSPTMPTRRGRVIARTPAEERPEAHPPFGTSSTELRHSARPPFAIRLHHFRRSWRVAQGEIHEVKTPPQAPWQNPFVERLIGTLRRECLDHVVVLNEIHLRRLLRDYLLYYPLLPWHPNTPFPGQGLPRATTGGAP
jgi:hypothetical protein